MPDAELAPELQRMPGGPSTRSPPWRRWDRRTRDVGTACVRVLPTPEGTGDARVTSPRTALRSWCETLPAAGRTSPGTYQRDPLAYLISSTEWSDPCWALQAEVYSVAGLGIDQGPAAFVLFGVNSKGRPQTGHGVGAVLWSHRHRRFSPSGGSACSAGLCSTLAASRRGSAERQR